MLVGPRPLNIHAAQAVGRELGGNRTPVACLRPGDFFGEIAVLVPPSVNPRRRRSAYPTTETNLAALSYAVCYPPPPPCVRSLVQQQDVRSSCCQQEQQPAEEEEQQRQLQKQEQQQDEVKELALGRFAHCFAPH